jgi:release factor glutamine methyltransferase
MEDRHTLEEALKNAKLYLKQLNIVESEVDAWQLMSYSFKISRSEYYMNLNKELSKEEYETFMGFIRMRGKHIPLQYITGEQEFMGLTFKVSSDVLIPRFDTEILVDEILKVSKDKDILDLCTGSGCIILSLSKLGNIKSGVGVDISEKALNIAKINGKKLDSQVTFILSDMFSNVSGKYDIIVSNPPYIPTKDITDLMDEVKIHEPFIALDGKEDGLYFYKKIIEDLPKFLNQNGEVYLEIGYDQGEQVSELLREKNFTNIKVIKDLAKLDRVVKATYSNYLEHFT